MVERSDETWSTGEGKGKPLQYSCLEDPMNNMKRQKDMTLNSPDWQVPNMLLEKSGEIIPEDGKDGAKEKQCAAVGVTGDGSKV